MVYVNLLEGMYIYIYKQYCINQLICSIGSLFGICIHHDSTHIGINIPLVYHFIPLAPQVRVYHWYTISFHQLHIHVYNACFAILYHSISLYHVKIPSVQHFNHTQLIFNIAYFITTMYIYIYYTLPSPIPFTESMDPARRRSRNSAQPWALRRQRDTRGGPTVVGVWCLWGQKPLINIYKWFMDKPRNRGPTRLINVINHWDDDPSRISEFKCLNLE